MRSFFFCTAAGAWQAGSFFKGFPALVEGKIEQAKGAQTINQAETGQRVDQAGSQQHHGHVDAYHGAIGVRQDRGGIQRAPDAALGGYQGPHDSDGDQRDDQAGQGGLRFMDSEQVIDARNAQAGSQNVKRRAGEAQRAALEPRARRMRVLADTQHHGKDADARQHLNEGIHAEAEQGQGLILNA